MRISGKKKIIKEWHLHCYDFIFLEWKSCYLLLKILTIENHCAKIRIFSHQLKKKKVGCFSQIPSNERIL